MKKAEQSEATRTALLQAARELFTEHGYAGTGTEDIAQRAGVTRGALYYQFGDKSGLFQAVFEDLNLHIATQVVSAIQSSREERGDLWDQIVRAGTEAYLDACLDPAVQRITSIEAPAVLGWEKYRNLDEKYGLSLIRGALQELMDVGLIAPQPVEPLAHLVLSAVVEAAMYIARADDMATTRKEMRASLEHLLDGLRVKG
ncbi:MAG: TetR/AcrR family transcriptional regulator [Desulfurellaceae bacterium]|nr:TetR/AcrR family transcriptional regulator [Desulfurellaceae bacterium]